MDHFFFPHQVSPLCVRVFIFQGIPFPSIVVHLHLVLAHVPDHVPCHHHRRRHQQPFVEVVPVSLVWVHHPPTRHPNLKFLVKSKPAWSIPAPTRSNTTLDSCRVFFKNRERDRERTATSDKRDSLVRKYQEPWLIFPPITHLHDSFIIIRILSRTVSPWPFSNGNSSWHRHPRRYH